MCKYEERCHPHPTPTHPTQQKTSYGVASTMCASARNILCLKHRKCVQVRGTLPSPPHPNPSHPTKNIIWRSIDHACKCKKHPVLCKNEERYHPHPTPTHPTQQKTSYGVASTMCASARNILCLKHRKCVQVRGTLPSPPHPNPSHPTKNIIWRSIDHVCKCKKHPMFEASKMCASTGNVAIPTPPQPIPPNKKHHHMA